MKTKQKYVLSLSKRQNIVKIVNKKKERKKNCIQQHPTFKLQKKMNKISFSLNSSLVATTGVWLRVTIYLLFFCVSLHIMHPLQVLLYAFSLFLFLHCRNAWVHACMHSLHIHSIHAYTLSNIVSHFFKFWVRLRCDAVYMTYKNSLLQFFMQYFTFRLYLIRVYMLVCVCCMYYHSICMRFSFLMHLCTMQHEVSMYACAILLHCSACNIMQKKRE